LITTHANNDVVLGNGVVQGTFNLDGGIATLGAIISFGNSEFDFNGGTLRPNADQSDMDQPSFMSGLTTANVRNGGAIIDTNGHNVTIAQPLVHSTYSSDNATDGGLTKKGAGTLTLTAIPTYTGNTVVSGGTLAYSLGLAGYSFPIFSSNSIKGAGSVLQVLGGGPLTIQGGVFGSTDVQVSSGGQIAYTGMLNMLYRSSLTVDGDGSGVFGGMFSNCTIGTQPLGFGTSDVVTVSNNGVFKATGFGTTYLNPTGTININGGVVDLSILVANGGTINFNSGSLSFLGNLRVGAGGLLGDYLVLDNSKVLTLDGTTTIDQFKTLTLFGGTLSTGNLINNGTFSFASGTLNLTGSGGLTIDSGGALGNAVTVGTGCNLNVTGPTILSSATANLAVNGGSFSTKNYLQSFGLVTTNGSFAVAQQVLNYSGATIDVTGGSFSALSFNNFGSLVLDGGTISLGGLGLTNNTGAYFYIGQNKTVTDNGGSVNAGEIQLGGASALLTGAGALSNAGLLHGDGVIAIPVVNSPGGEILAENGKRIKLTGTNGANAGKISLQGGTAEFSQSLTNTGNGLIAGRGTLITGGTGLLNQANVAFSSGITDVFGKVNNNTASVTKGITVSGNADVTFWDDVTNGAGSLFKVSGGSSATFFGTYGGAGTTGTGEVNFEADVTPGFSPAAVTFGGNVTFASTSTLHIDIGGTTPGNGPNNHD
jgi:autotransporter-associated beta strand protein